MFGGDPPPPPPDALRPDRILSSGHTGAIQVTAFSADSRRLATGADDMTIRIWDPLSGRSLQTLEGHAGHIASVAFSPDGKRLVSTSRDRTVGVWDVESGKSLFSVFPDCQPGPAMFSTDSDLIVFDCGDFGEDDSGIQVRRSADGSLVRTLESEGGFNYPLVAARDGSLLAASITDGCMTTQLQTATWDLQTGKRTDRLGMAADAISPDGRRIASVDYEDNGAKPERKFSIHDGTSGKELRTIVAPNHYASLLTFSSDGSLLLATLGHDGLEGSNSTVAVWDTASGKQVAALAGEKGRRIDTLAISPDGRLVVTAGGSRMNVWDLPAARLVHTLGDNHYFSSYVAFDREGRLLVSTEEGLRIWNVETEEEVGRIPGVAGGSLTLSADGNWLASNPLGKLGLWNTKTWTRAEIAPASSERTWSIGFVSAPAAAATGPFGVGRWHVEGDAAAPTVLGSSNAMAVSPDGKLLATPGPGTGEVGIWDAATSALVASFRAYPLSVNKVAFSPDGKHLLTAGTEQRSDSYFTGTAFKLWDVGTWRVEQSIPRWTMGLGVAELSGDGRLLAMSLEGGVIEIYDTEKRSTVRTLLAGSNLNAMSFSPDGRWFAASAGGGAKAWELEGAGI